MNLLKKPPRRKLRELRFMHYRTFTGGLAVPACDPTGRMEITGRGQTTPDKDKVTCGDCWERMQGAGKWTTGS